MDTPMTRVNQAVAEAARRYPEGWDHYNDEPVDDWGHSECQRGAFCAGVVWADANPKPLAITHDDIGAAYAVFMDAEGHPVRRFIVALKAIGIDVEDDDEH